MAKPPVDSLMLSSSMDGWLSIFQSEYKTLGFPEQSYSFHFVGGFGDTEAETIPSHRIPVWHRFLIQFSWKFSTDCSAKALQNFQRLCQDRSAWLAECPYSKAVTKIRCGMNPTPGSSSRLVSWFRWVTIGVMATGEALKVERPDLVLVTTLQE